MQLAPGIVVAERFRLERLLGQGGMGGVWRAHHVRLDVPCALKFIHAEAAASPDLRMRFEREARAAAQIKSRNVVQILDHGVWDEVPYIAMELLEGEDLAHRLRRARVLPPSDVLTIATQVGKALVRAHQLGVVHRDLKPGNIFLCRDEDGDCVKVLDFGVAKESSLSPDTNTKTGAILGTPFYMSPEQARGNRAVDHRSDLWALAVVVYQCITGRLPFTSDAMGDLFVKIIVDPVPIPSQIAPVPPGFDAWWMRAAARDPAQRFQSAKELVDGLALAFGMSVADRMDGMRSMALTGAPVPARIPLGAPPSQPFAHLAPPDGRAVDDARTVAMANAPTPVPQPSSRSGALGPLAHSYGGPPSAPLGGTPWPATPSSGAYAPPPHASWPGAPQQHAPMPQTPMPQAPTPTPQAPTPMPQAAPGPNPMPPTPCPSAPPTLTPVGQALAPSAAPRPIAASGPSTRVVGLVALGAVVVVAGVAAAALSLGGRRAPAEVPVAAARAASSASASAPVTQAEPPPATSASASAEPRADEDRRPARPAEDEAPSARPSAEASAKPTAKPGADPPAKPRAPPQKRKKDFDL